MGDDHTRATALRRAAGRLRGAVPGALRRPPGLVEQSRWLFALSALLSLVSTLPKPLLTMPPRLLPVTCAAVATLVAVWIRRQLTGRDPLVLDLVEVVAFAVLVTTFPAPVAVFVFGFAAVWFRALYGSVVRVVLYTGLLTLATLAAVPLWALAQGGDPANQLLIMVVPVPALCLSVLVARSLSRTLFAREQARRRDAALVELGHRLIGLTDPVAIHAEARRCTAAICAATPGLRAMVLAGDGTRLRVQYRAGDFDPGPVALPRSLLPADPDPSVAHPFTGGTTPAGLTGVEAAWVGVLLTEEPDGWIALGAPAGVPAEAVTAVQSMANQIALALRTSDAHHELSRLALVDPLTGLANRSAFTAALEAQHTRSGGYALLFLDLDDFKVVNDDLGHAAGDELLRHIAARLRRSVRSQDVCARLGGDEFAVLLRGSDDLATSVAQRLVEVVGAPVSLSGRLVQVGASLGLAFGSPESSADQLVKQADAAMYAAKAAGKNRMQVFDPAMLGSGAGAQFERELAAAAAAGQLVVHYQPIMGVAGGQPVAVEALVRWRHPTRGLLGPAEFVAIAERTGAILDIGAHVLRQACADVAGWDAVERAARLALHVNVSAVQLSEPGFPEAVRACLQGSGLAADRLVLEVTESQLLDAPEIRRALDELVELGAAIAIDDFGTGYSAISTLRTLPLDIVKVDRSFLTGCPGDIADEAVVEAIVEVGAQLGLRIVAAGVDRPDQHRFLCRVGADAGQGELYRGPAPADEIGAWLARRWTDGKDPSAVVDLLGGEAPAIETAMLDAPARRRTG